MLAFPPLTQPTLYPGGALPASEEVWTIGLSCCSDFVWSLRCALGALGAGRWAQRAIWLMGSLLGSEQKTHYPQWTEATERWFPLWKPLIPLLWRREKKKTLQERSCGRLLGSSNAGWKLQSPLANKRHLQLNKFPFIPRKKLTLISLITGSRIRIFALMKK